MVSFSYKKWFSPLEGTVNARYSLQVPQFSGNQMPEPEACIRGDPSEDHLLAGISQMLD